MFLGPLEEMVLEDINKQHFHSKKLEDWETVIEKFWKERLDDHPGHEDN